MRDNGFIQLLLFSKGGVLSFKFTFQGLNPGAMHDFKTSGHDSQFLFFSKYRSTLKTILLYNVYECQHASPAISKIRAASLLIEISMS